MFGALVVWMFVVTVGMSPFESKRSISLALRPSRVSAGLHAITSSFQTPLDCKPNPRSTPWTTSTTASTRTSARSSTHASSLTETHTSRRPSNHASSDTSKDTSRKSRRQFGVAMGMLGMWSLSGLEFIAPKPSRGARTADFGYVQKQYGTKDRQPLRPILLPILRVQEATVQESNLIKTGAYKDYARADVKLAIQYMLEAYELPQNMDSAATYASQENYYEAVDAYQKVVESLRSILSDYSGEETLIGNLDKQVEKTILNRLATARDEISRFMSYMPLDIVQQAQDFIEEENRLNLAEFKDNEVINVVEVPWKTKPSS
ncbi:hypothetical protein AAMO2058_001697400 [Amorphochlora amoebiformis]